MWLWANAKSNTETKPESFNQAAVYNQRMNSDASDVSSRVFSRFVTSFQPAWLKTEMLENTPKGFVHAGKSYLIKNFKAALSISDSLYTGYRCSMLINS